MKKRLIPITIASLLLALPVTAQQQAETPIKQSAKITEQSQNVAIAPTDTIAEADTAALEISTKRPSIFRRIANYYGRSNVDRTFEKKIDWSIAPGPNYSSDVGFGIGFLIAGLYRLDRTDSVTAPSNISIYGNVTTQKFVLLRFGGDNIFNKNKQRLSYSGAFVYFPGAFYGVGYDSGSDGYVQRLTTTMGIVRVAYSTSIVGKLYLGVSAGIDYTGAKYNDTHMSEYLQAIRDGHQSNPGGQIGELYDLWADDIKNNRPLRYDPAKQDPFSNFIATSGDNPNAFNTSVGAFLQYDSRDVTFNASKGISFKAEAKWYPKFLSNTDRNFGRFLVTFDAYQKLWKGCVFAYDLFADFTVGTPSWHMYAKLGGMERMRGYYEGRYRDKRLIETQIELRQKIYRRHGVTAWIGGGQVWGTEKFKWDNTLYSFGCGYRFEFKKRMNIRLDYGWGVYGNMNLPWDRKRTSAFLFTASEAF